MKKIIEDKKNIESANAGKPCNTSMDQLYLISKIKLFGLDKAIILKNKEN